MMQNSDRPSRFAAMPGEMKIPPAYLYPDTPVQPMTRWLVRMVVEGEDACERWRHDAHVWAYSSVDAVGRARVDFYGTWATAADRARLPLRVLEVLQVAI
ncbi:MAG TPA: hypothetical protein VNU71_17475 [Burkholderiaceae bacterium]|nr:hypothetical protein [Burkholderiaceae bacterium]